MDILKNYYHYLKYYTQNKHTEILSNSSKLFELQYNLIKRMF